MKFGRVLITCMILMTFFATMVSAKEAEEKQPKGLVLIADTGTDQLYGVKNETKLTEAQEKAIDSFMKEKSKASVSKVKSSKEASVKKSDLVSEDGTVKASSITCYIDGYNSLQESSISAIMTSQFDSTITVGSLGYFDITGDSKVSFSGIYGYLPDSIGISDKFTLNGLVATVSADGPGWESGFQSVTYQREATGYKVLTHSYTGVEGNGIELTAKQVTTGTFVVGNGSYTVKASDLSLLY